jgi:DNA-directed RNA polymerase subunit N (RpoN/RPB10)
VEQSRCVTCTDVTNGKTHIFRLLTQPPPVPERSTTVRKPYSKTNALIASGAYAICCNRMLLAHE